MKIEFDGGRWVITMDDDEAAAVAMGVGSRHADFVRRLGEAIDEADDDAHILREEQQRVKEIIGR